MTNEKKIQRKIQKERIKKTFDSVLAKSGDLPTREEIEALQNDKNLSFFSIGKNGCVKDSIEGVLNFARFNRGLCKWENVISA